MKSTNHAIAAFYIIFNIFLHILSPQKPLVNMNRTILLDCHCHTTFAKRSWKETLPKAQRTRGLSSGYQIKFFNSYHKFSNKSLSDFIFIFLTKQQLQNVNQISALRLNINFKILTKRIFWVSTKNNLHNLNQGSAAKYWLNFSFKISPELQLQNLEETLCSKSGQQFDFMTKLQLPNLHQLSSNHF